MRLRIFLFLTALLATLGASQSTVDNRVRNADAEIVEAALLSFFEKTGKLNPEWSRGTFVVARPEYRDTNRYDFKKELRDIIDRAAQAKDNRPLKALVDLRDGLKSGAFKPDQVVPLAQLKLDDRIVFSDEPRGRFEEIDVVNRQGRKGSSRGWAYLWPPAYSADGKHAIVRMLLPWSMHSAKVMVLLERAKSGWKVLHCEGTFYV